jgi:hypothetical protein
MAGRPRAQTQIVPPPDVLDNQAIHTKKWTNKMSIKFTHVQNQLGWLNF